MDSMTETPFIVPDWPCPANISALTTLRYGGYSAAPYDSFNLGAHVGDAPLQVQANRQYLQQCVGTDVNIAWLEQVHGTDVVDIDIDVDTARPPQADAAIARRPQRACVIMTADCLPVLLCAQDGSVVAAAHAGWRGLLHGVLEQTVQQMACPAARLLAWLGPCIGPQAFEVGDEVQASFTAKWAGHRTAFIRHGDRWLADLPLLAKQTLQRSGVTQCYQANACTYSEPSRFFSYRRDQQCGRMATLIWRNE